MVSLKKNIKGGAEAVINFFNAQEELNDPNARYLELKRYIQSDFYSCAIQSAYTVLDYYELIEDESELDEFAEYEGLDWTPLKKLLKSYGIRVTEKYGADETDIKKAIDKGFPIITTINNCAHWIVIYGYSTHNGSISHLYISDPIVFNFSVKWTINKFKKKWKKDDEEWIAICKYKES